MNSTSKIMSAVEESCLGSPFTQLRNCRAPCSTSSGVTNQGPSGLKPGAHLPLLHCPPETSSWKARSDRSSATAKPATWSRLCTGESRYEARRPMTSASSTSQSVLSLPGGIVTGSSGPLIVFGVLRNTTGFFGGLEPDSAACAA